MMGRWGDTEIIEMRSAECGLRNLESEKIDGEIGD